MPMEKTNRKHWLQNYDYGALLATLLAIIATTAFVDQGGFMYVLVNVAYLLMMGTALYSFSRRRSWFIAGLVIGVATQVTMAVGEIGNIDILVHVALALRMLFLFLATLGVFSDVIRQPKITMNAVFGACTVYLLLALSFGSIFALIEKAEPGSFDLKRVEDGASGPPSRMMDDDATLTYFSMVTLTTVGYGDITPISAPARVMSALEGLIGQLFVAVVLARIVAMEITSKMRTGKEPPGD